MQKSIQELSIDSRVLYDRLISVQEQGFVSYKELSEIVGRNVQKEAYGNLSTAKKMAMREDRMIFGSIMNEGLKRLNDVETINTGEGVLGKIRRASKKGIRTVSCIADYNSLPNESKIKHNATLSALGVLNAITRPNKMKQLEAKVEIAQKTLPVAKTLLAFMNNDKKDDDNI